MAQLTLRDGWLWFVGGWRIFKKQPWLMMLGALAWLLIEAVFVLLPVAGELIDGLLLPAAYAGFVHAADRVERGEGIDFKTFFYGITQAGMRNSLLVLGLCVVLYEIMGLLFTMLVGPIGVALFAFPMGVILMAALIFAVPAVVLESLPATQALRMSFNYSGGNISALIMVYFILFMLVVASIVTVGIGLLFVFPLTCCSLYVGYQAVKSSKD